MRRYIWIPAIFFSTFSMGCGQETQHVELTIQQTHESQSESLLFPTCFANCIEEIRDQGSYIEHETEAFCEEHCRFAPPSELTP